MTTRILITTSSGASLCCLDGNHGAQHAQEWADTVCAQFRAQGIEPMVFELSPAAGGDHFRRDVLEQSGRIRPEFRQRPDGTREVVGWLRLQRVAGAKRAAAATPSAVPLTARIVSAPADVHGARQPIRIPRGRQNSAGPRTDEQRRQLRRMSRANTRGQP